MENLNKTDTKYLFVLCGPFSGSTALWKLLSTSSSVSSFPLEGQRLEKVKPVLFTRDRWDPGKVIPWREVKMCFEENWDLTKPVLLEKSPPHLFRAFDIEKAFPNCYFIIMYRNPYACIEALKRRSPNIRDYKQAAKKWVDVMMYQMKNIEGLQNKIYFSYEDFTGNTREVLRKIVEHIPELKDIKINAKLKVRYRNKQITNFNNSQIRRLRNKDIEEINTVLCAHKDLMMFFDYEYIKPSPSRYFSYLFIASGFFSSLFVDTAKFLIRVFKR